MTERQVLRITGILVVFIIIFAGFGSSVLYLWNWLMPSIFGLRLITYWEAMGLMGLSWILFGGLRGFGMSPRRHGLSPEERDRLQRGLKLRTGCRADTGAQQAG